MTVTVYQSTDGSAPVLRGATTETSGTHNLVNLLQACLVDGYGAKAGAGWTCPYTNGSPVTGRVFRQGGGSQFYLQVDDSASGTGGAKEAVPRAAEAFSAWNTISSGEFPTTTQLALASRAIRKSTTADDTTDRAWTVIATDRSFWLLIYTGDTASVAHCFFFGDFESYVSGDSYNCGIILQTAQNSAAANQATLYDRAGWGAHSGLAGHYMARVNTGLGSSFNFSKSPIAAASGTTATADQYGKDVSYQMSYPNPADNGLHLGRWYIIEPNGGTAAVIRGLLPGLWHAPHGFTTAGLTNGDTFSGVGALTGKTFLRADVRCVSASCAAYFETSDTWGTL